MTKAIHAHFIGILPRSKEYQDRPLSRSEGCDIVMDRNWYQNYYFMMGNS